MKTCRLSTTSFLLSRSAGDLSFWDRFLFVQKLVLNDKRHEVHGTRLREDWPGWPHSSNVLGFETGVQCLTYA